MLNVLIALGIFATILVFLQGCAALHRVMTPRGTDRAIERLQKWSAPESVAQMEIVRKESFSDIPWLHDLLATMRRLQPLRVLHRQADCRMPLGSFVLATPLLGLLGVIGCDVDLASSVRPCARAGGAVWCGSLRAISIGSRPADGNSLSSQLPEALELVSRALKAGHAFSVGLKLVGDEAADPDRDRISPCVRRSLNGRGASTGAPEHDRSTGFASTCGSL